MVERRQTRYFRLGELLAFTAAVATCSSADVSKHDVLYLVAPFSGTRLAENGQCASFSDVPVGEPPDVRISPPNAKRIEKVLVRYKDDLVDAQRHFFSEPFRNSAPLRSLSAAHVVLRVDDSPNASADNKTSTITFYSGLIRLDIERSAFKTTSLCALLAPHDENGISDRHSVAAEVSATRLRFILRFQLAHEMGHLVLAHGGRVPQCEESEADRFALDYLYSEMDPALQTPRAALLTSALWPSTSGPRYSSRGDREDRVTFALALMDVAARPQIFEPPPDPLRVPGAFNGATLSDRDLWQANLALERLVTTGTQCYQEPRS